MPREAYLVAVLVGLVGFVFLQGKESGRRAAALQRARIENREIEDSLKSLEKQYASAYKSFQILNADYQRLVGSGPRIVRVEVPAGTPPEQVIDTVYLDSMPGVPLPASRVIAETLQRCSFAVNSCSQALNLAEIKEVQYKAKISNLEVQLKEGKEPWYKPRIHVGCTTGYAIVAGSIDAVCGAGLGFAF